MNMYGIPPFPCWSGFRGLLDLVGYGPSSEPCYEGSGPAPLPDATQSVARRGCADTNDNANDFTLEAPHPQSSSTTPVATPCGPPTAAVVRALVARRSGARVTIRWRTSATARFVGFDVYREIGGRRVKANASLVPAAFAGSGRPYAWIDRAAPHGSVRYWLRAVATDGSRTWFGPAPAT